MATRSLKKAPGSMSMDEAAGDNRVAALLPVNNRGEIIDGADPWQMPAGPAPDDEQGLSGEFEDEPETPTDRVLAMLSDVSDDPRAYVKISRLLSPGKFGWCDDVQAAEFEAGGLKMIRDKWGAGDYQIVLYGQQPGTKRFVIRTRATVQIVGAPMGSVMTAPQGQQGHQETGLAAILQAMQENQRQMFERFTSSPAVDPNAQMMQTLTMLKLMKETLGPTEAPKSQLSDTLSLIKELKGATKLFEGGDSDGGLMGMAKDMLPAIAAMAAQRQQPQAQTAPQLPAPPAPQDESPSDEQLAAAMGMSLIQVIKLRANLAVLVTLALMPASVEDGAEHLLDSLPDELLPLLDDENWWLALTGVAPALKPHEAWCRAVHQLAVEILNEPDEEINDESASESASVAVAKDKAAKSVTGAKAAAAASEPGTSTAGSE